MRLQTDALRKRYDDFELSIPNFQIDSGTAVGLVGNNGAGKTTVLRLVLDLVRADEGSVRLDGEVVADTFDWKTRTGSYLGASFLIDFLTPDEYWHFVGQTYDLSEAEIAERLSAFEDFYVDEPFASLDPKSQIQLKELLQERHGATTMLIASHDLGHVTDVSDRIAILEAGTIVRDEPSDPDTLKELTTYFRETIRPEEDLTANERSAEEAELP